MATDTHDDNPWTRPPPAFVRPPPPDLRVQPPAAIPEPEEEPPAEPLIAGPPLRKAAVVAMLGAAAVAGVGIGWGLHRLRPVIAPPPAVEVAVAAPPAAPALALAPAPAPQLPLPVEAVAPPTPAEAELLAALPPEPPPVRPAAERRAVAKAPARVAPPRAARPAPRRARAPVRPWASPYEAENIAVAAAGPPTPQLLTELPPPPRGAGPCGWAQSKAQRMLCEDRGLARTDQRMRRAYDRALGAGVPASELAADQADWGRVREDAAQQSRSAVARVYDQRIDELEALARRR